METNDNPGAQASPLLDAHPLQPSSLEFLADWEIRELILQLEAEQRRREQARWEEAERVRRENPGLVSIYVLTARDFVHINLAPLVSISSTCVTSGTDAMHIGTTHHRQGCKAKAVCAVFFFFKAMQSSLQDLTFCNC